MKKVTSTISQMGVIGLALLALVIATVVWLFERTWVEDLGHASTKSPELEAISLLDNDALEGGPAIASDDKAEGSATLIQLPYD